jgi:hypothetical protein
LGHRFEHIVSEDVREDWTVAQFLTFSRVTLAILLLVSAHFGGLVNAREQLQVALGIESCSATNRQEQKGSVKNAVRMQSGKEKRKEKGALCN